MPKSKTTYKGKNKGKTIGMKVETLMIKGKPVKVEKVIENNVVVALPMIDSNTILIERQYRPTVGKYIYELPAGHIDMGETPRHAIIREMREETGLTPRSVKLMFRAYPTPGSSAKIYNYFLVNGLYKDKVKLHMDPDEIITIKRVSLTKALGMIRSNIIRDNKTIAPILYYVHFHMGKA